MPIPLSLPQKTGLILLISIQLAYGETYKKLIKDQTREVLLPVLFYMDGAMVQSQDNSFSYQLNALKFAAKVDLEIP